jgi:hypothetical protein
LKADRTLPVPATAEPAPGRSGKGIGHHRESRGDGCHDRLGGAGETAAGGLKRGSLQFVVPLTIGLPHLHDVNPNDFVRILHPVAVGEDLIAPLRVDSPELITGPCALSQIN